MNKSPFDHPRRSQLVSAGSHDTRSSGTIFRCLGLPAALLSLSLSCGAAALADETDPAARPANERSELEVTMRIIEDPEAIAAEAVMRRISLPPAAQDGIERKPEGVAEGSERGREFGEEVSERARELAEQAKEQREDFGRSRAEDMRPEPPEPPGPPPR